MKNYQNYFETATGGTFRPGNRLTLLQNGDEIFAGMLGAIREAQTSIEFVTYVYWHSRVAIQFADALIERARAGIQVRLLVDAVGGAIMSTRMVHQMEQAGVRVAWFRPLRVGSIRRINQRTHRKILIVDGRVGFTGGVGIADQWDGNADGPGQWRETHSRIEGPACLDLAAGFASNWAEAAHERLPSVKTLPAAGPTAIMTTLSVAGRRPTAMETLFEAAIAGAQERLWITSAYFIPSPAQMKALCAAVSRGVDVRILTNGPHTNHKVTLFAGRSTYGELIAGGVKIYEYQLTVLHCKLITVDRQWATLGSANLDYRSLLINDELNISVVDAELVAPLDRQFLLDLKQSHHISASAWQARPALQRWLEAGSSAFSKQL